MQGPSRFSFGKHKGESFEEVRRNDKSYCAWAQRKESPTGGLKEFARHLESQQEATPKKPIRDANPPAYTPKRRRNDDGSSSAVATVVTGAEAQRLQWHLMRGGLFKKKKDGRLVSTRRLTSDE